VHTLLVTVDYLDESLDLGLPAEAPISEFLPTLIEVFGIVQPEVSSPAEEWELTRYGGEELPAAHTLQNSGVIDGMRLALRNQGTVENVVSRPISGRVHVFPYPPDTADTGGPRVHWIHKDLFNE
jgi:hypothetical protein